VRAGNALARATSAVSIFGVSGNIVCIVPIVGLSGEIEFPSLFLYSLRVASVIDT
jgi:hypothetical protein